MDCKEKNGGKEPSAYSNLEESQLSGQENWVCPQLFEWVKAETSCGVEECAILLYR